MLVKSEIMMTLGEEWTEFHGLVDQAREQVEIDGSQLGDMFRPFYENGLELSLLDQEARMDEDKELLSRWREFVKEQKTKVRLGMETEGLKPGDFLPKHLWKMQQELEHYLELGIQFKQELNDREFDIDSMSSMEEEETCNLYSYLEMYIDKFSLGELAVIMDVLEQQRFNKDISWWYYVQCGLAVCSRLVYRCPKGGWNELFERLKKDNQTYHKKTCSYEDRFYGEMNISIEDAIDRMRECRLLAEKNNMSVQDMWYQIQDDIDNLGFSQSLENFQGENEDWENMITDQLFDAQFED